MNLDNLTTWIAGVALAAVCTGNIDFLNQKIVVAQLKLIKASQTQNWGSPRFFSSRLLPNEKKLPSSLIKTKEGESKPTSKQSPSKEVLYEN